MKRKRGHIKKMLVLMSSIIGLWAVAVAIQTQKETVHSPVKHIRLASAGTPTPNRDTVTNTTASTSVAEHAQGGNLLVRMIVIQTKRLVLTAVCISVVAMVWSLIQDQIKVIKYRKQEDLKKKAKQIEELAAEEAEQVAQKALKWVEQQNFDAIITATDYDSAKRALDTINDEGNALIEKCIKVGQVFLDPDARCLSTTNLLKQDQYKAAKAVWSRMENAQDAFVKLCNNKSWDRDNMPNISDVHSLKSYDLGIPDETHKGYYRPATSEEEKAKLGLGDS